MPKQLVGTKYADMSEDYKSKVSKKEYRQRKQSQRMAGEAIKGGQTREEYQQGAYDVDSLDQFDARRAGAGSAFGKGSSEDKMGRGANRFSKADAKGLFKQGFSAEEIQKYAAEQEGKDGFIFGDSAQAFLQKKIAKAQQGGETETGGGSGSGGTGSETGGGSGGGSGGGGTGGGSGGGGSTTTVTNTQEQVVNQDNDQSSVVNGDGNTVSQSQDNSVSQQGGNNRMMNYTGGSQSDMNYIGGSADFYDKQAKNAVPGGSTAKLYEGEVKPYQQPTTTTIDNNQTQEIRQDNDQSSVINGNNNYVNQSQDNSIRQYGGDNRSFVYNGGSGSSGLYDSPVSAATMGGFYDVNDSPAANAAFNDRYTTQNADNQKRYAGTAMDTFMKFGNLDARSYTPESMATAIDRSTQNSFDRADRQTGLVMGDIWNDNYTTGTWKHAGKGDPIESNAEEIADDVKDDIDDV